MMKYFLTGNLSKPFFIVSSAIFIFVALLINPTSGYSDDGINMPTSLEKVSALKLKEVTFCRFPSILSTLPYIADKKGYFEKYGIHVMFHDAVNGKICQDELVTKRVDYTTIADGPFAYLSASAHPLKILAVIQEGSGVAIATRKDFGIETFTDLKGRRLAYLPGTISALFVYSLFEQMPELRDSIKLTALQPPVMVQALIGGQIDGFAIWDPWVANVLHSLADKAVRLSGQNFYRYIGLLMTHDDFLRNDSQHVSEHVMAAIIDADEFVRANPEEAFQILSSYLGMNIETLRESWKDFNIHVSLPSNSVDFLERAFALIKKYDRNFTSAKQPNFRAAFAVDTLRKVSSNRIEAGWK